MVVKFSTECLDHLHLPGHASQELSEASPVQIASKVVKISTEMDPILPSASNMLSATKS